jgi:catechol 2,3-dioxygenase-like lactoylglutathione lyase family enzyme
MAIWIMMNHFRVARHTANLEAIERFYVDILGLKQMGTFEEEDYQGVFIGERGQTWHLEYTQSKEAPQHRPDDDDLLVFYLGDYEKYTQCVERLLESGVANVAPKNPYWDRWGKTFLDPDGYRIVICHREWTNE